MSALHATTSQPLNPTLIGQRFHVTPTVYRRQDGTAFRYEYWLKPQDEAVASIRVRGEDHHEAGVYELVSCTSSGELVLEKTVAKQSGSYMRQCLACGCQFSSDIPVGPDEPEIRMWIAAALAGRNSHQPARLVVEPFGAEFVCPGECASTAAEA